MALELRTPVNDVIRHDVAVADASNLLDPDNSSTTDPCLVAGEWLIPTADGWDRPTDVNTAAASQVFSQKGDFGVQALSKVAVIRSFGYEAETDMYEAADDSGVDYAIGQVLAVETETIDSVERAILTNSVTADEDYVHAVVTALPTATASGKLRFMRVSPYRSPVTNS
tara:strand:+ start:970 stop:1476 length:507 start_codon:yes stop_codon:yes gene_type:complete